jgi:hypothetical protein
MQQALQQVYCINAVQASTAVLSEPNSMNFTSCSTMLQLHNLSACFNHLTDLHMRTAAPLPIRRISQQFFAATMRLGLTPEDLLQMKPETHAESIVTFMNAVVSGTEMDQLQAPYFFDCVIHSIMPVEECMAKADLRPVPQAIEYAPGCHDCFYKTYRISTPDGNSKEMHFRINTCMSEDLRQLRVLKTTHSLESQGDCEDFSQGHVSVAKGIMDFKEILDSASKGNAADMRLHDVFNPAEFHTLSNGMQVKYIGAFAHLLAQVEHIKCECVTGNARDAAVTAATTTGQVNQENLVGHSYTLLSTHLKGAAKPVCTIVEGTRFVNSMVPRLLSTASAGDKTARIAARNSVLNTQALMMVNKASSLQFLATMLPFAIGPMDKGCFETNVATGMGPSFYANAYVCGNKLLFNQSIPGVESSALIIGSPITYLIHDIQSLRPMEMEFNLSTNLLMSTGCPAIEEHEIKEMMMSTGIQASYPAWTTKVSLAKAPDQQIHCHAPSLDFTAPTLHTHLILMFLVLLQEFEKFVFSRHLPCSVLYDDPSVTKSFVLGKHAVISFTHQVAKGMNMDIAKQYAENIISVFHHGKAPPVTQALVDALHTHNIPPMMPQEMLKAAIPAINVAEINSHVTSLFSHMQQSGASTTQQGMVRVERIFTCMGVVMTTCIVEVEKLPNLTEALASWAKPIVEANASKTKACIQWRMNLESKYNRCTQGPSGMAEAMAMAAEMGDHEHRRSHARRSRGQRTHSKYQPLGSAFTNILVLNKGSVGM